MWLHWLKSSGTCLIPIDSCHSSFRVASSIGMLAALFGPIEEQARLSIHPHILLWSVHTQSEQWLRRILRKLPTDVKVQIHGAFMVDISNPDPVYAKCKVCSIKIDPVTKQCKKARESRCPSNPWGDDPNLQHPPGRFLRRECRHPGRLRHPLSASRALLTLQHCRLSWKNQAWLRARRPATFLEIMDLEAASSTYALSEWVYHREDHYDDHNCPKSRQQHHDEHYRR